MLAPSLAINKCEDYPDNDFCSFLQDDFKDYRSESYYDRCPTGAGGKACNAIGADSDPVISVVCLKDWGLSRPADDIDVCTGEDSCDGSYLPKENLCNFVGAGHSQKGYCYTEQGECPELHLEWHNDIYSNSVLYTEGHSNCQLFVKAYAQNDYIPHTFQFYQNFSKRNKTIIVGREEYNCAELKCISGNIYTVTNTNNIAYCFKTTCNKKKGWVADEEPCPCDDQSACINGFCNDGKTCYTSIPCTGNGWDKTKSSPLVKESEISIDNNCYYNPNCTKNGWVYEKNTYDVLASDGATIKYDDFTNGKYFYNESSMKCYYNLQCVNCGEFENDAYNYCSFLGEGGYGASVDYCPPPGTVIDFGSYKRCYYGNGGCTENGCEVKFDLMFGDAYTCNRTNGAVLNTPSISVPKKTLQSFPPLLMFGYLGIAKLTKEKAGEVQSCSAEAQEIAGESENIVLTPPIDCSCVYPDKKLIEGYVWKGTPIKRASVCSRLFSQPDCFWDYEASFAAVPPAHGKDLLGATWCKSASKGHPCEFNANKMFRFIFNVSTLIDLKLSVFNPKESVPVYLSVNAKGENKDFGMTPLSLLKLDKSSGLDMGISIANDPGTYYNWSFTTYCIGDPIDVKVNGNDLCTLKCNGWASAKGKMTSSFQKSNTVTLLSKGTSYIGVDCSSPANPVIEEMMPCKSIYKSGGTIFCFNDGKLINVSNPSQYLETSDVKDVEVGDKLYILHSGSLNYSPLDKWAEGEGGYANLIASAYGNVVNYSLPFLNGSEFFPPPLWIDGDDKSFYVGAPGGVEGLPDSAEAVYLPHTIYDGDFIGVDNVSPQGYSVSVWSKVLNAFMRRKLFVTNPFSGITAGEFSRTGKVEYLTISDGKLMLISDGNTSPVKENGNDVVGVTSLMSANNVAYFIRDGYLYNASFFHRKEKFKEKDIVASFLFTRGSSASLDLITPDIYVEPTTWEIKNNDIDFVSNRKLGDVLFCGEEPNFTFSLHSYESYVNYTKLNLSLRLDNAPIECINTTNIPLSKDGSAGASIKCHIIDCPYGLPVGEELSVCVRAGTFEEENCHSLDVIQPLAGDPRGLKVNNIKAVNSSGNEISSIKICKDISVRVTGDVEDSNNRYTEVSGSRAYRNNNIHDTNNSLTPVNKGTLFFDSLSIPVPTDDKAPDTYTLSVFAGNYYETMPVKFLSVSKGSPCTTYYDTPVEGSEVYFDKYYDCKDGNYGCGENYLAADCSKGDDKNKSLDKSKGQTTCTANCGDGLCDDSELTCIYSSTTGTCVASKGEAGCTLNENDETDDCKCELQSTSDAEGNTHYFCKAVAVK